MSYSIEKLFNYKQKEIAEYQTALEEFKTDIPKLVKRLRDRIAKELKTNLKFQESFRNLKYLAKKSINDNVSQFEIIEMIIQHLLTEPIFKQVFNNAIFHKENSISQLIDSTIKSFLDERKKREFFAKSQHYFDLIELKAKSITDPIEKNSFLNVIYENFYKAYNPKSADTLGIVYTPHEIVNWIIDSVDFLSQKHFQKSISDSGVNILDPATGTGTFIVDLIKKIPAKDLLYKYQNEIHANEISLLAYYIASLAIENALFDKIGKSEEFENIIFADTLEVSTKHKKGSSPLFSFTQENFERIDKQEKQDINIIVGNPPYNANQQNENDNNKNKENIYIDERIENTYVKKSTAQNKTNLYDMYTRFIRWSSDRIGKQGIVGFVVNSSFIDAKSFDGFRKDVYQEFNEIWVLDLGGNIRRGDKDANVFNIKAGVAILILIKTSAKQVTNDSREKQTYLYYQRIDHKNKDDKLNWLAEHHLNDDNQFDFKRVHPDKDQNWIKHTNNDWEDLIPIGTKETKAGKKENAIFKLFSNGIVTARDQSVYDFDKDNLDKKIEFFIESYNSEVDRFKKYFKNQQKISKQDIDNFTHADHKIKWSRNLKNKLKQNKIITHYELRTSLYRPFTKKIVAFNKILNDEQGQLPKLFPKPNSKNIAIGVPNRAALIPFTVLMSNVIHDLNSLPNSTQTFALHRYENGKKIENITDWSVEKFQNYYSRTNISKTDIFYYIYSVLHNPNYRKKYEINLKRSLPRIPLFPNFSNKAKNSTNKFNLFKLYSKLGRELASLHTDFESIQAKPLRRADNSNNYLKPKLKISKDKTFIEIDNVTKLYSNQIENALDYKLGNRSAIEWVLDQYKEKKITDKTVQNAINNGEYEGYEFIKYKESVIKLLNQVMDVSVNTLKLIERL